MQDESSGTGTVGFEVGSDHQDRLFKVLSHHRRRFTLQYLQTVVAPLTVDELTAELAAWEDQGTGTDADRSRDGRASIKVSLVHNHLPTMADVGIVEYDDSSGTVTLADGSDEVHVHLQAMTTD